MMKHIVKAIAILLLSSMFFACSNSVGGDSSGNNNNNGNNPTANPDNPSAPIVSNKLGVRFDFSNAKALAKLETKNDRSRAVTDVDDLGDLVKILEDGKMENAITVGENCELSDIVAIYKSPLETSQDIFIVFNGESTLGYQEEEITDEWGNTYTDNRAIRVGQLICLHSDGSIADILKKDNPTDYWNTHMSLNTNSVTFDAKGNLYFISSDNGDLIYQFTPKTNELTKMVAAVENTWYNKMQIDDEGQWIFVSGNRNNNSYFLRAIPVNNPNGFVNIYYSSNYEIRSDKWVYDDKNGIMYFIVNDGGKDGLFISSKKTGFKEKVFNHKLIGENFDGTELFEDYLFYTGQFKWNDNVMKSTGVFDSNKAVEVVLSWLPGYYDYRIWSEKRLTLDNVDIRFDKWLTFDNDMAKIALLTQGKKNQEAFEALNTDEGREALWKINYYNEGYFAYNDDGYLHNALADILYIKDTDILLDESEEVLFDYKIASEEDAVIKSIKGTDIFEKYNNGKYSDSFSSRFSDYLIDSSNVTTRTSYRFSNEYYDNEGNINASKVLEFFYSYCNLEGNIDFSLTSFDGDKKYNALYSTLKNERAIQWIAADADRMDLFFACCGLAEYQYYDYENNEWKYIKKLNYYSFMNMLAKTCFINGTNEKAITWNCEEATEIDYSYSNWNGASLSINDSGVYYEYYNVWDNWTSNPYYYIIQVSDSNGKLVELVNRLPLPAGKVVRSEKNKDRVILQYSITDDSGSELGYHHIYAVGMENGEVTNCFDNVPNHNSLEVVSFNVADDLLYYSAVRGTAVENGIVNIVTNEYNPLTVQRKMVAVYTF